MNISKELLSEVLELKKIDEIYQEDNLLYFCESNKGINIYELAHKCKEWAEYNGWFLYPCRNFESTLKKFGCSIMKPYYKAGKFSWLLSTDGYDERDYLADTEIQAVFKACQWILDNKKEGK